MPGSILVSVLELIDLPITPHSKVEGNNNDQKFVLKVAMGKREYQTSGTGDFSFKVSSLRENLVLTLLDAEGNELSQTDVKTMLVVEKGIWDAWFPFEGGGSAHLKLQFLINDGDRKRVHEMREAALKRKYANLLDNGGLSPKSPTKLHQADLFDQLQQIAPVLDFNHQLINNELILYHTEASRKALVERNEPQVRTEQSLQKDTYSVQLPLAVVRQIGQSSKGQPTKLQLMESLIPRKLDRDAAPPSPLHFPLTGVRETSEYSVEDVHMKLGPLRSFDSGKADSDLVSVSTNVAQNEEPVRKKKLNCDISAANKVKNMISAFENNFSQEMKSQRSPSDLQVISRSKEIYMTGSSQGPLFAEANTAKAQDGEILTKSFSAGMPYDMNMQKSQLDDIDKEKMPSSSVNKVSTIISKNIEVKEEQNTMGKLPEKADMEEVQSSKIPVNSSHARITSEVMVEPSPEYLEILDKKEQDEESNISIINQENPNINQDIMELKNIGAEIIVYDSQETECDNKFDAQEQWETTGVVTTVVSRENIEPCNVSIDEEQSVLEARVKSISRNESSESYTCRSSTPLLDFVSEAFFVGYPDFGMKRRICITTCTKTMMDLVGGFNIPVEACPTVNDAIKLSFSDEYTDDPSTDMIRDDTVPRCSRKLEPENSIPKYKGKLIKQVIRITVIVMACGTFILKIR